MKVSWGLWAIHFLLVNTPHDTYRNMKILKEEVVPGRQVRLKFEITGRKVWVRRTSKKKEIWGQKSIQAVYLKEFRT